MRVSDRPLGPSSGKKHGRGSPAGVLPAQPVLAVDLKRYLLVGLGDDLHTRNTVTLAAMRPPGLSEGYSMGEAVGLLYSKK